MKFSKGDKVEITTMPNNLDYVDIVGTNKRCTVEHASKLFVCVSCKNWERDLFFYPENLKHIS